MSESSDANAAPEWLAAETPTNPVSRLLAVLERLVAHRGGGQMATMWAEIFGLDEGEAPYKVIAQTLDLMAEAREAVELQVEGGDKELYLDPFDHLGRVFGSMLRLDVSPEPFINEIKSGVMSLRFCAAMVDAADEHGRIDVELMAELWATVNSLLETVLASDLPEAVRSVLYERIRAVRQAIENFQLVGLDGLEESLDGMTGALIRHGEDVRGSEVRKGYRAVLELGHRILVSVGKAKELAEPLFKLLGSGDG